MGGVGVGVVVVVVIGLIVVGVVGIVVIVVVVVVIGLLVGEEEETGIVPTLIKNKPSSVHRPQRWTLVVTVSLRVTQWCFHFCLKLASTIFTSASCCIYAAFLYECYFSPQ